MGRVFLLGAGSDEGHLTKEGLYILKNADAILYDDLIDKSILEYATSRSEKIYVGKRYDKSCIKQDEINKLLYELSKKYDTVVRLKGGDPFVFGRGAEEMSYLKERGINCSSLPGITTPISILSHFGIPITERGISSSFTVITGTLADDKKEIDYESLVKTNSTLVFLMGLKNIDKITSNLILAGLDKSTPASLLSRGFYPDEARFDGTVFNISDVSKGARSPAILCIGNVCKINLFENKDKDILVTGTKSFTEEFKRRLYLKTGITSKALVTIDIVPLSFDIKINDKVFKRIVFTSRNGVKLFFSYIKKKKIDIRSLNNIKFSCIGNGTAGELIKHDIYPDHIPKKFDSKTLARELVELEKKENDKRHLLILRAENGSKDLTEILDKEKISYSDIPLYKTENKALPFDSESIFNKEFSHIIFGSKAGVNSYLLAKGKINAKKIICIGDETKSELLLKSAASPEKIVTPKEASIDGLINEII